MKKPDPIDHTDPAAVAAWVESMTRLGSEIADLAFEAATKKPHRRHARHWIRGCLRRRLRELSWNLAALAPTAPGDPAQPAERAS